VNRVTLGGSLFEIQSSSSQDVSTLLSLIIGRDKSLTQKLSVDNKAKYLPLQIWRSKSNFRFLGHTTVTVSSDKLKKKNIY